MARIIPESPSDLKSRLLWGVFGALLFATKMSTKMSPQYILGEEMKTVKKIFATIGFTVFTFGVFMILMMTAMLILLTQLIVRL